MSWRAAGRYARPGDSPPGESAIERDIFATLNFVLGDGCSRYKADWRWEVRSDMMFPIGSGVNEYRLVVEYDGEFWHRDREKTDLKKVCDFLDLGHHNIIRLRQRPLRRIRPADIQVPRTADAVMCSRLLLLHLLHRPGPYGTDDRTRDRIWQFLSFGATQLYDEKIYCDCCLELNYVINNDNSMLHRRSARKQRTDWAYWEDVAADLTELSLTAETAWMPGDRTWEKVEADAYERRGFRDWLQHRRTAESPIVEPTEVGTTIPLLTKQEAGSTEDS